MVTVALVRGRLLRACHAPNSVQDTLRLRPHLIQIIDVVEKARCWQMWTCLCKLSCVHTCGRLKQAVSSPISASYSLCTLKQVG